MMPCLDDSLVQSCREQFPALRRLHGDEEAVFLDGPAGTQTPQRVIDAVSHYFARCNANHGGMFATSQESDEMLRRAHEAFADFVGAGDPGEIYFGANFTSLTFALSRALAREWSPGDEIVVTQLDHDANYSPWVLAARDAQVTVRIARVNPADCTLDLDHLRSLLNQRTRLVAVGCASNATGGVSPVDEIVRWARGVGSRTFLDAVHSAPHAEVDVRRWNCDFVGFSAYKLFGPHLGVMWGRRELLESLTAYKVRPASNELPDKWMTGTQNHEGIAGALEAVEYLADLGRRASGGAPASNRRSALLAAYQAIGEYERRLCSRLLAGLAELPQYRVLGLTDPAALSQRLPTVSITHRQLPSRELAKQLGERGIFAWHGNYYALNLSEALGLEPQGMLRLGMVHYNTPGEVDRALRALREIA